MPGSMNSEPLDAWGRTAIPKTEPGRLGAASSRRNRPPAGLSPGPAWGILALRTRPAYGCCFG